MTGVDYFAWFVFIVIIVSVLALFVVLAGLPGKIANDRKHPQAEAINAAGWLGLLFSFGIIPGAYRSFGSTDRGIPSLVPLEQLPDVGLDEAFAVRCSRIVFLLGFPFRT